MDTKKEQYRRVRGLILNLLAKEDPRTVDAKVLHYLLDDLRYTITEEEFLSHMKYLAEGGLVRRESRASGGVEVVFYAITREGMNLVDGFGPPDVGIDVRF